ncbi:hypothetical protein EYM_07465 [Ignicoccus islandicus DSM 13165]|uniref:ASCH domain-containing protein n=1 Tax=Ignicoccus islandicus DSM 13165 TaxID=940295 RepID=A0A0U2MA68_9CREN|nr:ASCH domain-containing protein [Ignicoccus islandicus]ALU12045.1 hypothetical protein EYM_07465 [Ignicoccus islandicus DSM 13165]
MGGKLKYIGRHLMVKGEFVDEILSGRKRATIRLGIWKPKFNELILHGGGRPFAIVRITDVEYKRVKDLTEEDARADGFNSMEELMRSLRRVYPHLNEEDYVTILKFQLIKKLTELDIRDPYMGLKPSEIARLALRYLTDLSDEDKRIFKTLTETESLRETAIRLFGSISKRWIIRKKLKKALNELIEKGLIGPKR